MNNFRHMRFGVSIVLRKYATKPRPTVIPDENMLNDIKNNLYKPRNHPGIVKAKTITVPDALIKAAENVIEDYPKKGLIEDGETLTLHLRGKHPPIERVELKQITHTVQERVSTKLKDFPVNNEVDEERYEQTFRNKVDGIMRKEVYNWKPVNYNTYTSLVYLVGRFAPEYAVLVKIFSEISTRDPNFRPRSMFDFGSGVGTATWAANNFWKGHIFEYFNVDSSPDMNDLSQILLQEGKGTKKITLKGVFYRQFLPATNTSYDLVVSAYSLLELPSRQARLETILNLWNKTEKYLVVVEQGSKAGFKVINEVRDFILHARKERSTGHVFSPCPHDVACPRFLLDDNIPCNFETNYFSLPLGAVSERRQERFCYIVLKKGERDPSDPQWPRLVSDVLVRSKHSICRMCTKNGNLQEVIFTASKQGKTMYHCARSSHWGDLLPIKLEEVASDNNEESNDPTESS